MARVDDSLASLLDSLGLDQLVKSPTPTRDDNLLDIVVNDTAVAMMQPTRYNIFLQFQPFPISIRALLFH